MKQRLKNIFLRFVSILVIGTLIIPFSLPLEIFASVTLTFLAEERGTSPGTTLDGISSVFVVGNYAYVTNGTRASLAVIDISDPNDPVFVAEERGTSPGTTLAGALSVFVEGDYAYVATAGRHSLAVLDISDPNDPVFVAEERGTTPGTTLDGAFSVVVEGDYAYVATANRASLAVLDISDPNDPVFVAEERGTTPGTTLSGAFSVTVEGNYAYLANAGRNSLAVIDISDPNDPVFVAEERGTTPDTTLGGAASVSVQGNYAYVANYGRDSLAVIDISNPSDPVFIAEERGPSPGTSLDEAFAVFVSGDYAYVASSIRDSLAVIDISDPSDPVFVVEEQGPSPGTSLDSATAVFVSGNYAYVAAGNRDSLAVIEVDIASPNPPSNLTSTPTDSSVTLDWDASTLEGEGTVVFLTSGTSWAVPSDWNSSNNSIEVIGGGGGGAASDEAETNSGGGGGGGGAYSAISNVSLTPGGSATYAIGAAGIGGDSDDNGGAGGAGGDTYFNGASCGASSVCAKGGGGGTSGGAGAAGGVAGSGIGSTKFSGGTGGDSTPTDAGGGGGGGAAGPHGDGGDGGSAGAGGSPGGGGGGANGGGDGGVAGADGGAGGNNRLGSGGGAGGSGGDNGDNGSNGGGGGGGDSESNTGGSGSQETLWTQTSNSATAGPGGGGGGGGHEDNGGAGGSYGGGGGGGGVDPNNEDGAPGIIVITYQPVGGETPDPNIINYAIYRDTSSPATTLLSTIGTTTTTYQDSTILAGVKYFYRVTASYGSATSTFSNEVTTELLSPRVIRLRGGTRLVGGVRLGGQSGYPVPPGPMITMLTALGVTSNLQFCLDAGDSNSYASGQSWLDTSPNGQSFFRGTTSGAEGSDPTFNGTPGGLSTSEYFSFDGGDNFTYDTANETWMNNIHKDNSAFTFVSWIRPDTLGVNQVIAGTLGAFVGSTGFRFRLTPSGFLSLQVTNAGATVQDRDNTSNLVTVTPGAWNFVAVSSDETVGTGGLMFQVNRSFFTRSSTYTSPASGNASHTLQIGAAGNGVDRLLSGNRIGIMCAWSRALSETELRKIHDASASRFSL